MSAPARPPAADGEARQRAEIDADRLMMQMIQTSISLIGIGFTINAFFNDIAVRGMAVHADQTARRLGLALLCMGLLFLAMGTVNQARLRRQIHADYGPAEASRRYSATPSFVLAILLLIVGLGALASIVLRMAW